MEGSGKLDSSAHLGEGDTLRKIRDKMEAKRKEREVIDRARAARASSRVSQPGRRAKSSGDLDLPQAELVRRNSGEIKEASVSPRTRLTRDSRQVFAEDRDEEPAPVPLSPRRSTVLKEEKPSELAPSPRRSAREEQPKKEKVEEALPPPKASPAAPAKEGGWFSSIASSVASTVASAIMPTPAPPPVAVIEDHFLQNKSRVAMEEIKETLHLEGKLDKILDIIMVQSQVVDAIELGARKRIVDLERKVVELEKEVRDLKAQTIKL